MPIFLSIANCISQSLQHGVNASEPFGRRTELLITPTKVQPFYIGPQLPIGQSNTVKSISVAPWDLCYSFHPQSYPQLFLSLVQTGTEVQRFLPSCSQTYICQDRHRAEAKLLGRFAPSPQCLTVWTYLSLSLQPQPRTHVLSALSVLPRWHMAMRQPRSSGWERHVMPRHRENTTIRSPKLFQNVHETCQTT